jgi:hypothetical protein
VSLRLTCPRTEPNSLMGARCDRQRKQLPSPLPHNGKPELILHSLCKGPK